MKKRVFTAPGRIEIGGNHTDHQHGLVLAAAVNLEIKAYVSSRADKIVSIENEQYGSIRVDLSDFDMREEEKETSTGVVRGVAAWFNERGYATGGFDASITSTVPVGSGLSSSAAFEVLIGNIFKGLYGAGVSPLDIALAGKYAENVYFGKPCGLMDQAASSFGGLSMIDFGDPHNTVVTPIDADFSGYEMCVVETGGSHADLTSKYAAIPQEMGSVANFFGNKFLASVDPEMFYQSIKNLRAAGIDDRAILRAIHFFDENGRVKKQAAALMEGNMAVFLDTVRESGRSSLAYLQNVFPSGDVKKQGLTLALALSERILAQNGASRVHGGGFAGTILTFVPNDLKERYKRQMCDVFGDNSCHFLSVSAGGTEVAG
ncbi:MAG: galactokinase [Oscillospiraceae bacterium]|nr:galactokinase [Oscillospiraceae bacterium]